MKLPHALIRLAWRVFLAFGLLAFLALLGAQAPRASAASPSFIRIMNASPDVGTVNIFVDGAKFLGNATFATVTDYLQLPAGHHRVQAALIGKGVGAVVIAQTLSVQAGNAYTVAAIGTKSTGFSLQVLVDNNLMASGMAKVRVYQLSPRPVSVSIATATHTLIGVLSYPQASNYIRLPTVYVHSKLISAFPFPSGSGDPEDQHSDQYLYRRGVPWNTPAAVCCYTGQGTAEYVWYWK